MTEEAAVTRPGSPPKGEFSAAMAAIFPLLVALVPFGLLFGTLAAQKGLSPLEVFLMSASVFAGAAQFVAVEIWSAPVAVATLTTTALMVNLRHILMGAALAPGMAAWPRGWSYGGLFFLADEIWAFALRRHAQRPLTPAYYGGLVAPLYLGWVSTTTLGTIFGGVLQDPARYGLDFAFTAVFLTLLAGLWQGRRSFAPWAVAALAAVAGHLLLPGVWYIALGALAGTLAGALLPPKAATVPAGGGDAA